MEINYEYTLSEDEACSIFTGIQKADNYKKDLLEKQQKLSGKKRDVDAITPTAASPSSSSAVLVTPKKISFNF
jgi:hypothetical protein